MADKSFSQLVCGQTVITGVLSEPWFGTPVEASLFSINGLICDEGDDELSAAMSNLGPLEQGFFVAIDGHDMEFACRFSSSARQASSSTSSRWRRRSARSTTSSSSFPTRAPEGSAQELFDVDQGALRCRSGPGAPESSTQELFDVDHAKELLKAPLRSFPLSIMPIAAEVFAQELFDVNYAKEVLKALLRSSSMSIVPRSC